MVCMLMSVAIVEEKMINLIKKIRSNRMQSSNCMIFFLSEAWTFDVIY